MSVNDIFINDFGYSLGSQRFRVDETSKAGATFSDCSILQESGFEYHHVCQASESAYDLAAHAVDNLRSTRPNHSLEDIDVVIYATCLVCNGNLGSWESFDKTKDVKPLMDFPVSHLQSDFNMSKAFVLGINQTACTSLLGSIRMAKALLTAEPDLNQVLCLTADRFPENAIYEQGYNLISDGAACCTISRQKGEFKVIDCHHISNGAMAQASDDETAGFYFNYTFRSITEILQRNNMSLDQISWIVPQNTNVKAWQILTSVLKFDFNRVLMPTRTEIGHCISGDNIINLKVANEQGIIQEGDRVLMPMAGFGLNWSCIILEKVA